MTTGVCPDSMVAGVGSTGRKLPAFFSLREEVDAGRDVVGRAALGDSAAISTPENAAPAWVGSPLSATLPLNSGLSRSSTSVTAGTLAES